jgi:NAD dependent epimerase/dehydratase family enzyme
MSWIHIDDLCRVYIHAIEAETLDGPINGVAPNPVTNRDFVKCVAKMLKRPILFPPIPKFVLKFLLGEMVIMAVEGSKVSSSKIQEAGFKFEYLKLEDALRNLLS